MATTVAILCKIVPQTYARRRVEYAHLSRIVPSIVDIWSASAARSCAKTSNLTPEPPKLCTVMATTVAILCQIVPQTYARHRVEYAHLSRIVPSIVDLWSASAARSCAKTSNLTPEPPKLCTVMVTTVAILCQIVPQTYARHRVEYAHLSRIVPSIVDLWSASAARSCAESPNLTPAPPKLCTVMATMVAILCKIVPQTYARHRVEYAHLSRLVPSIVDLWSASAARSCAKTSNLTPEPPKLCTVMPTTVAILCRIVAHPYARYRVECASSSRIVPSIVDLWSASAARSCAKTSNLTPEPPKLCTVMAT